MWAFATARREQPDLFAALSRSNAVLPMQQADIAKSLWAAATLRHPVPSICELACSRDTALGVRDAANVAWAFARLSWNSGVDGFYKRAEKAFMVGATKDVSDLDVVQTLWAFAHARVGSDAFFEEMRRLVLAHGPEELPHGALDAVVWAFSVSGRRWE
eukprot:Hpha_TRINITY_DN6215_c0_g1::TRINITY_DN6215_c0_g1_i1::g.23615::m.23615